MTNIQKIDGSDELWDFSLDRVKDKLPFADIFVYNYKNNGYDGSGFAVWEQDGKFGYTYLGHCSCNGPLDDLNSILYSFDEIRQIANKYEMATPIIEFIEDARYA